MLQVVEVLQSHQHHKADEYKSLKADSRFSKPNKGSNNVNIKKDENKFILNGIK